MSQQHKKCFDWKVFRDLFGKHNCKMANISNIKLSTSGTMGTWLIQDTKSKLPAKLCYLQAERGFHPQQLYWMQNYWQYMGLSKGGGSLFMVM